MGRRRFVVVVVVVVVVVGLRTVGGSADFDFGAV